MVTIDVTFDTYKELTVRRATEAMTYDEVIRGLLKLPPATKETPHPSPSQKGWIHKGVMLPEAAELRATYKGVLHTARIVNGKWMQDGVPRGSPSEAAHAVTGNSVNGWMFWEARFPGESKWRLLKSLR
jgi:hypothetical protein